YREIADLEDLTAAEHDELWHTTTDAVRAVKKALKPGGVNVGINLGEPAGGSVRQHLHVHVVPRWHGDANFMPATATTRTLPARPRARAGKLGAAWRAPVAGGARVDKESAGEPAGSEIRDELPEDLDASEWVGPYQFPDNSRRRIP